MTRRSLRFRLTVFVSVLFGVTLIVTGLIVRNRLQSSLEQEVQARSEAALEELLFSTPPNTATEVTNFVFFDEDGEQITAQEFDELVRNAPMIEFPADPGLVVQSGPLPVELLDQLAVAEIEALAGAGGFTEVPGGVIPVDLDPGSFTVAAPVMVGELELAIGLSSPRGPIDSTVRTITTAGAILIPLLTALVAFATWMTTSRALRPVEAIRVQVEQTNFGRLDLRVPQTGTDDEVDRLAGTMNDMLDRLDRAAEQQRQFISDASHELRSPITATLATVETIDGCDDDAWPSVAATIAGEQHRLAGLVDDLLLLAQLDEMGVRRADDVDLDELAIEEAARNHPCQVVVEVRAAQRVVGPSLQTSPITTMHRSWSPTARSEVPVSSCCFPVNPS
jgi:signal transduction histidine kinase